jgi:transcriptional regulator with XRE-family HTH domain
MDTGSKLKNLRLSQGLTLEDVGNAVGVGKSTVRKWETGDIANMRRDKIAKLASALHTTPAYIMGWSDDPNPVIEKPAPIAESELDNSLIKLLVKLTPDEIKQVDAFVQGLIAARKA